LTENEKIEEKYYQPFSGVIRVLPLLRYPLWKNNSISPSG